MARDTCDLLCLDLEKAERLRAGLLDATTAERAARSVQALSDPTRLAIATVLAETDELCVCDVAWIVGRSQNLASHHLRALRSAGLAASRRDGKLVLYRATEPGRTLVQAVVERGMAIL
jgi:DNA-binding transcriptional ArsR family regulator